MTLRPDVAIEDAADVLHRHADNFGDRIGRHRRMCRAKGPHEGGPRSALRVLALPIRIAAHEALRLRVRAGALSDSAAPLRLPVRRVVRVGAQEQVLRIHARRYIAAMQHTEAVGYRPAMKLPRDSVGELTDAAEVESPVAPCVWPLRPKPASRVGLRAVSRIEPLSQRQPHTTQLPRSRVVVNRPRSKRMSQCR